MKDVLKHLMKAILEILKSRKFQDSAIGLFLGAFIIIGIVVASLNPERCGIPKFANETQSLSEIWRYAGSNRHFQSPINADLSLNLRQAYCDTATKQFYYTGE